MVHNPIFRGTGTALVTPFTAAGAVDETTYRNLIEWQIAEGVEALVVLGTTGENATIWPEERKRIVEIAVEQVAHRVPLVVGAGNNSTSESIVFSRQAKELGADALLIVAPYYNKPTQQGIYAHVRAIAEEVDCPIILYNVPGRTSVNIKAETTLRIATDVPNVRAVKEASGDLAQISDILANRPDHLAVYSGDDELTLPILMLGGDGVISVLSNGIPRAFGDLVRAGLAGDFAAAREMQFRQLAAMRACFYEANPIPIKTLLGEMGKLHAHLRLPLVAMEPANRQRLMKAFEGLI